MQNVPTLSISKIVTTIKNITERKIFKEHPELKKELWGSLLWTSRFYANIVGQYAKEEVIKRYVRNQDKEYNKIHQGQLDLELA